MDRTNRYEDILYLPHHVSKERIPMPRENRAAQFAPFAALTGHDAAVAETARLTTARIELDEGEKAVVNAALQQIVQCLGDSPKVTVTYFVPDRRKSGGEYITVVGTVGRIDELEKLLILTDRRRIPIEEIIEIGIA